MLACDDAALAGLLDEDAGRVVLLDELARVGVDDAREGDALEGAELLGALDTADVGFFAADDVDTVTADELPELDKLEELPVAEEAELVDWVSATLEADTVACGTAAF